MTVRRNTAGMGAFSSFRVMVASVVFAAMAMLVWSPSTLEAAGDRQMVLPGFQLLPNKAVIRPGGNGLCDDPTVPGGDDVRQIGIGQGQPFMVTVRDLASDLDAQTLLNRAGDDILTAVICAGGDGTLTSTTDPADLDRDPSDPLCFNLCIETTNCIIPGDDGTLQTTAASGDVLEPFISSGPNGIAESAAAGNDNQFTPLQTGYLSNTIGICIDSGANGTAETSICGNGLVDDDENGADVTDVGACDDGNTVDGDGCGGLTCLVETGWSCTGTPSVCTPICGDGVAHGAEPCDDGNASNRDNCLNNCQLPSCGDGFIHDHGTGPFEQCDGGDCCSATCTIAAADGAPCNDGSLCTPIDTCLSGVCQGATVCGNGVLDGSCGEECDDGGVIPGDGCTATCKDEFCGDDIVNNNGSEECDDGNNRNTDGCVVGCKLAECGDGFKHASVEDCDDGCLVGTPNVCELVDDGDGCSRACVDEPPVRCGDEVVDPGEECDDGNNSNRDDCLNTCKLAVCGDGRVHDQSAGTEQCDDDNTAPGDGCSPTCTLECGNGVLDGACSEGSVGAPCSTNVDCDTTPGNGVCIGEQCDPGKNCTGGSNNGAPCGAASVCPGGTCAPIFCVPGPQVCSAVCLISTCGNGAVECSEECDLGSANGVSGSGCTALCQRNLVGANELTGSNECLGAWTLDSAPQDLRFWTQVCTDGASSPCDFDGATNGRCTFRVGVCLNRPAPAGCIAGGIQALDLQRLKFRGICTAGRVGAKCFKSPLVDDCETSPGASDGFCLSREADAAASITDAVRLLAPTIAKVPDRCRAGLKGKVCSIADDNECDRVFGGGGGLCDIGAGVEFDQPLNAGDQATACTPSVDVVVDVGRKLKLSAHIRRMTGRPDNDRLVLVCTP